MTTTTAQLKPADGAAEAPAKKKSKKKLIMMLVPVLLLAGGGYFFMGRKSGPPPPPEPGEVVALEAITINLDGGHYLKLGLALQAPKTAHEAPDGSRALDIAIEEFSNLSIEELSVPKKRKHLKEELREKVIHAYEHDVMDIYFTEFVMQ